MAIRYAVAPGNWSNTSTWNGGTLPTSADDVYANLFTVTIDTSPTVLSVQNGTATGVTTAGGTFVPTNGITLTCTSANGVICGAIGSPPAITSSLTTGQSCTIIANLLSASGAAGNAVNNASTGTVNIIGNSTGSTANSAGVACLNSSTGTVNLTGNCTGGGQSTSAHGIQNAAGGTVNITGNCTGGTSLNGSSGASNSSIGIMNITGTINGGPTSNSSGTGAINSSSGTLNHVGTVQASSTGAGIGPGSTTQITVLTGPFLTTANGINPVIATRWFWANSIVTPTYYQIRTANLATIRPLYTADSVGGNPATTDVRSGTIFGPSNELTGTVAVPPANSVLTGVPVDNTVGSGTMDPTQFWNYPISGITTSGSIGERLKTAATVNVMGQLISDSFSAK